MSTTAKETRETLYWLNLLKDTDFIDKNSFDSISQDCKEILTIINSITLTSKDIKNANHK